MCNLSSDAVFFRIRLWHCWNIRFWNFAWIVSDFDLDRFELRRVHSNHGCHVVAMITGWVINPVAQVIICTICCPDNQCKLRNSYFQKLHEWEFFLERQRQLECLKNSWIVARRAVRAVCIGAQCSAIQSNPFLPHSVYIYALRHSTPAAALMSETCFGHNYTWDLSTAS